MKTIPLKIKRLNKFVKLPKYETEQAACFDLEAFLPDNDFLTIAPGHSAVVRTGLAFEIPTGYKVNIHSRSGHGFKHGISLANSEGKIDADYRGEVLIKLKNDGPRNFTIYNGVRIAQAEIEEVIVAEFVEVEELSETDRGEGGFGHTGM